MKKTKEEILETYESFRYTEDGCDEVHYYKANVLMAMEEYHQSKLKNHSDIGNVIDCGNSL